jgi:hypothetical protein
MTPAELTTRPAGFEEPEKFTDPFPPEVVSDSVNLELRVVDVVPETGDV